MKKEHKYAQLLRWVADGETIQLGGHDGWTDIPNINETLAAIGQNCAVPPERFRLKPRTITVNGREVQAGESEALEINATYCLADPGACEYFVSYRWTEHPQNLDHLRRGLVHLTKEAAIAHAKAMLNID